MAFEVYTTGGGDYLATIFNAGAAIMSSHNFLTLIKIAGVMSLLWVILAGVFKFQPIDPKFLLMFILVYGALFSPKIDVVIIDSAVPAYSGRVISNVPWGLGWFAHLTSKIGFGLTGMFEAVFSPIDENKYSKNGMIFNSYITQSASQFIIRNDTFSENMTSYMKQCVFYDILLGRYSWRDLVDAKNIWNFIQSQGPSVVRMFTYKVKNSGGSVRTELLTCQEGVSPLTAAWTIEVDTAGTFYGKKLFPKELTTQTAKAKLLGALPVSYAAIMDYSATGADLIRQNMMINITKRALRSAGAAADATASVVNNAQDQAELTLKITQQSYGKMAAKLLPVLRNVLEAILIGVFPFILLLMFMPVGGQIFLTYVMALFWLQLWAPLYSMLNIFMNDYAISNTLASGPTIANQTEIITVNADAASIAGYIAMSIPVLAWALVSGGKYAATQIAGAVTSGASNIASESAGNAAKGNMRIGEVGAYNTSMFQSTTAPSTNTMNAVRSNAQGDKINSHVFKNTATGLYGSRTQENSRYLSTLSVGKEVVGQLKSQSVSGQEIAATASKKYERAKAAHWGKLVSLGSKKEHASAVSKGMSQRQVAAMKYTRSSDLKMINSLSKNTGLSVEQSKTTLGSIKGGVGVNTAFIKATAGGSINTSQARKLQLALAKVNQTVRSEDYQRAYSTGKDWVASDEYKKQHSKSNALQMGVGSEYKDQIQKGHASQLAHKKSDQYSQAAEVAGRASLKSSADLSHEVAGSLKGFGVDYLNLNSAEQQKLGSFYLTHGADGKRAVAAFNSYNKNKERIAAGNTKAPQGDDQQAYTDAVSMHNRTPEEGLSRVRQKVSQGKNRANRQHYNRKERDFAENPHKNQAPKTHYNDTSSELVYKNYRERGQSSQQAFEAGKAMWEKVAAKNTQYNKVIASTELPKNIKQQRAEAIKLKKMAIDGEASFKGSMFKSKARNRQLAEQRLAAGKGGAMFLKYYMTAESAIDRINKLEEYIKENR